MLDGYPINSYDLQVDFAFSLAPCIRKGHEKNAEPLLAALTEARKSALASLDPSRTIASAEMVSADARKYLVLLKVRSHIIQLLKVMTLTFHATSRSF